MTKNVVFNPICSVCGNPMGEMSEDEFAHLVVFEGLFAECFDCGPKSAIDVPLVMLPGHVGEKIVIDGIGFWCSRNVNLELRWRSISQNHKRGDSLSCSSSSTYPNILPKKDSRDTVFFDQLENVPSIDKLLDMILPLSFGCDNCEKIRSLPGRDLRNQNHWYCDYHRELFVNAENMFLEVGREE